MTKKLACYNNPDNEGDSGVRVSLLSATQTANTEGCVIGAFMSPGQYNWDMSIAKLIKIRESKTLELRGEFFNTFNHPQFSFNPVDDPALSAQDAGGSTFGQVTVSSVNPRLIQLVKFLF